MTRLLDPRSVVMIGGTQAARAITQCDRLGFDGEIWAVHPRAETVEGRRAYPSLEALPDIPDAAFVAVNRERTVQMVQELAEMGAGGAVLHAAGFAEAGERGARLQAMLVDGHTMPLIGPNCYGTINARTGAALWPDVHGCVRVDRGPAFIGQSGNIGLNATMNRRGVRFSRIVSVGNQASVTTEALISHLVTDPATTAIGLYVESLHDAVAFGRAAMTAREHGVPIVVLRSGTSATGAQIATTHTAAMAAPSDVSDAVFERYGVIVVESLSALLTTLALYETVGPIGGKRLLSLSCSGGEAALVADRAHRHGVSFEPLAGEHADRVRAALSDRVAVTNPLDYHTFVWGDGGATGRAFTEALDGPIDAAMLVLDWPAAPNDDGDWWTTVGAIVTASDKTGTPAVVASTLPEGMPLDLHRYLAEHGVGAAPSVDEALAGLAAMADLGAPWSAPRLHAASGPPVGTTSTLDEPSSKQLLRAIGISIPPGAVVGRGDPLPELTYPVVAKRIDVAHKSDVGGVMTGLTDPGAVRDAIARLGGTALIEEQITEGVAELLISVRRVAGIGEALTLGAGGIMVGLLDDTVTALLPLGADEVGRAVARLRIAPMLDGHRGRVGGSVEAVAATVEHLQRLMHERPDVREVEINPLIVTEHDAWAVDALVIAEAGGSTASGPNHTLDPR